jgi:nucleoid-associated protein YgaU
MLAGTPARLVAQDVNTAAIAAAREEAEERYKRLHSAVEELQASHAALQKRLAALAEECNRLREDSVKAAGITASQEDLRKLAENIVELDQKREADKKLILDKLEGLAAAVKTAAFAPPSALRRPNTATNAGVEKGYEYIVQPGDVLSKIIKAYRDNGIKVSLQQITNANPGLNPNNLKPGQKIFIPQP